MPLANRNVLYVSYNGMLDPLGQSQVIPYLKELSRLGVRFTLLSYERAPAFTAEGELLCKCLRDELAQHNIEWHYLAYHQRPSLPATAFDVAAGVRFASRLVKRNQIEMVHARAHIPAVIALALKRRFGVKMIFDLRGLMAEEYIDAGHWRKGSVASRLTKTFERRALAAADGVVTLTERIWPIINQWNGLRGRAVAHEVIPCCADLQRFRFSGEARDNYRRDLGIEDRFVVVYSGSIDGWYLTEEMAAFFATLVQKKPKAFLLWLTQANHDRIGKMMRARNIDDNAYRIIAAQPRDVPAYLSASDVGLAFIKPCFSKLASSPTKYAEYLGCGLPLVINAGVGDSDALITDQKAGLLIHGFTETEYSAAVDEISTFGATAEETRRKMHSIAAELFDLKTVGVERYARLYQRVLAENSDPVTAQ